MTVLPTDKARAGIESRTHKVLKVLVFSLAAAVLVMFGLFAFA